VTLIALLVIGVHFGLQEPPVDTQIHEVNRQGDDDEGSDEISLERYLRALDLEKEGKLSAARVEMRWLAPLGRAGTSRGIPEAHLWMANDLLDGFDAGFLLKFPLGAEDDSLDVQPITVDENRQAEAFSHLIKALELRPDFTEALLFRAALLIAKSDRETAISSLIDGAAVIDDPSRVVFPLIHAIAYKGDEVGLREQLWAGYSTLGNDIARSRKVETGDRIRYALFALLRGEYEGFEISLNRLEASAKKTNDMGDVLAALKVAPSYHRAVLELVDSSEFSPSETAAHLGRCLEVAEGSQWAAPALAALVEKYPSLKTEVSSLIDQQDLSEEMMTLLEVVVSDGGTADQVDALKNGYLESSGDSEALLRWAKATMGAEQNDPELMIQLQRYLEVNRTVSSDEDVAIRVAYAHGLLEKDDVVGAITVLEGALQENGKTDEVRSLLVDAYHRLELSDEAKLYESMSDL